MFLFKNLDETTRNLMKEEAQLDIDNRELCYSKRFNDKGKQLYPELLFEAISKGNEATLASTLRENACFASYEYRGDKQVKVPVTASETFAEGEFNRFYIRGLCLRAISENKKLKVYRAKESASQRSDSQSKIGISVDPNILLNDLRENIGFDTYLKLPNGPNSGLSVELF